MSVLIRQSHCRWAVCILLPALALCGCKTTGTIDALEADLRAREQEQEELLSRLSRAESELKVARSDAAALRQQLSAQHQTPLTTEQADVLYRAEAIRFQPLFTSGQDRDGEPGDEGLSVMLIPVDAHGDLVKLAGDVELELFDMSLPAEHQRLGDWKFTTADVRTHWHRGLVASGYLFQVDWQSVPATKELTLHAKFRIPDGRQFDATTQVKVVPPNDIPPVAGATESPPGAARRKPTGTAAVPASASVEARRPVTLESPDGSRSRPAAGQPAPPAVRRRSTDDTGRTTTSDRWTEETIPRLR